MLIQRNTKSFWGEENTRRGGLFAKRRRGSLAVEAAIFLPLFIVGVLTLGYLIRFTTAAEGVSYKITDEAHKIAGRAAFVPLPVGAKNDIAERVLESPDISEAEVHPFFYRTPWVGTSGKTYTDLIGFSCSYTVPLKIPHIFKDELKGEETVLCRAFVGKDNSGDAMPFSEMEKEEDGKMVWVFPRAGEKYHGENCRYIKAEARETLLDSTVRRNYSPCELCKPQNARNGALVYCFPNAGRAYHIGSCTTVKKYVIEISEKDAKEQGYTACSVCNGG